MLGNQYEYVCWETSSNIGSVGQQLVELTISGRHVLCACIKYQVSTYRSVNGRKNTYQVFSDVFFSTNVQQILPVPWSKVNHFRENVLQVIVVLAVLAFYVLRGTASINSSIARFCYADIDVLAVFRNSIQVLVEYYCCTWSIPGFCSTNGCCQVLAVFCASVLRVSGYENTLNRYAKYTYSEYKACLDHQVCTTVSIIA